jgi:hypothetical protein
MWNTSTKLIPRENMLKLIELGRRKSSRINKSDLLLTKQTVVLTNSDKTFVKYT